MHIITFLSDFGDKDPYVGIVKGVILKELRGKVNIVDLTHKIPQFSITSGAYVIKSAYPFFPEGTLHLVIVDPTVGSERRALAVYANRQWFLGPDNGILSYILPSAERIREISPSMLSSSFTPISYTFHARDVFAPACVAIIKGKEESIGRLTKVYKLIDLNPLKEKRKLVGRIIYIDHFGNLITNILASNLPSSPYDRAAMRIRIKNEELELSRTYSDVPLGNLVALINSSGHLEIGANRSSAKELLFGEEEDLVEVIW